jgi:hypothetical protein
VQVKRLIAAPAALAEPPAPGHRALHPAAAAVGDQAWPASPPAAALPADAALAGQPAVAAADVTALLDEAFGAEPR